MTHTDSARAASYAAHLYPAAALRAIAGANQGDSPGPVAELCAGDVYALEPGAEARELRVTDGGAGARPTGLFLSGDGPPARIAPGSQIGRAGERLALAGRLTFLDDLGERQELILVRVGPAEADLFVLPLAAIEPRAPLTLIGADACPGEVRVADVAPVAFARGTRITLSGGAQMAVEQLAAGARILTRDHGGQKLIWAQRRRFRALGRWAPVVIAAGALGNAGPLVVSQDQRLFIYRAEAAGLAGTAEILVRAGDLVNGREVSLRRGGYVEYWHLLLPDHEIIYAECIPTESLLLDARHLARLPEALAGEAAERFAGLARHPHFGREIDARGLRLAWPNAPGPCPRSG